VVDDGYRDQARERLGDHRPAGPWRGGKYSAFEGGTRVPFILRWPARVKPGTSDALICQIDLLASFARLAGQQLAEADAPDSQDVLTALLGDSGRGREMLVEHANALSIRKGRQKFIEPKPGAKVFSATNTESGNHAEGQLYDLGEDPGEKTNLAGNEAGRATELRKELDLMRSAGRTRRASP
jgi:arylsulfatase A-like enzyme